MQDNPHHNMCTIMFHLSYNVRSLVSTLSIYEVMITVTILAIGWKIEDIKLLFNFLIKIDAFFVYHYGLFFIVLKISNWRQQSILCH